MSDLRVNTISDAAGTGPVTLTKQSAAKAWVNFDGTGTIAARNSANVSSLTDNGTGDYSANFTNAFAAADYVAFSGNGDSSSGGDAYCTIALWSNSTTALFRAVAYTGAFATSVDSDYGNYCIHGDLA